MSTAARIDELGKKFEENPRRYFAPLANELRKAGELDKAIALCREHLPKQPGHMSGYIVFGQALYEAGLLDEARAVFEQALALDPENLIALRHLGDIAKADGDAGAARRWYERVLDADPRNDDIASQLATLVALPVSVRTTPPANSAYSTPPVPQYAVGTPTLPTPDQALRAVDFDLVNARMTARTPLDLDAIESAGSAAWGEASAPAPVDHPVDAPVAEPNPVGGLETDPIADEEGWESSSAAPSTSSATPPDARPAVDEAWFVTPPAGTRNVDAALGAFAAHDPLDEMQSGDVSLAAVAPEYPFAESNPGIESPIDLVAADSTFESISDDFEEGILAAQWPDTSALLPRASSPRSSPALPAEISPDAADAFGREPHDPEPASVDVGEPVAGSEDASPEFTELVTAEFSVEVTVDSSEDDAPLPFLDTGNAAADEEIVDAFLLDAEGMGESSEVVVTGAGAEEPVSAEVSFADVLETSSDEAPDRDHEEGPSFTSSDDSPAFVTETMAELLVSQGFLARAASVYEELVRRHPYDQVLTSRLAELREQLGAGDAGAATELESPMPASFVAIPTPSDGTPIYSTPSDSTPAVGIAAFSAPTRPTPAYDTPAYASPLVTPPHASTAYSSGESGGLVSTARERFAQLAARRVPRRTPPQPTTVVTEQLYGLSALFGENDDPGGDDAAARALADAFAPISDVDAASGAMLDFSDDSPPVADRGRPPTPPTADRNTDFSFDRFFPDPATTRTPPTEPAPAPDPSAPVGDDLAQFSAWLKGLGST